MPKAIVSCCSKAKTSVIQRTVNSCSGSGGTKAIGSKCFLNIISHHYKYFAMAIHLTLTALCNNIQLRSFVMLTVTL